MFNHSKSLQMHDENSVSTKVGTVNITNKIVNEKRHIVINLA